MTTEGRREFSTGEGGDGREEAAISIGSRIRSRAGQQGNLPRAIDRQLKIYGFTLLIEDTSEHTARVSDATARRVVSSYGRYAQREALGGCPNRARPRELAPRHKLEKRILRHFTSSTSRFAC